MNRTENHFNTVMTYLKFVGTEIFHSILLLIWMLYCLWIYKSGHSLWTVLLDLTF